MAKNILKYLLRFLLGIVIIAGLYFAFAWGASYVATHPEPISCERPHTIYVASNGVHLDIILPAEQVEARFKDRLKLPFLVNYLAFGWGDKGFYLKTPTWDDLDWRVTTKAIFWPTASVMHLTYLRQPAAHWKPVQVCDQQLVMLLDYFEASFKRGTDGQFQLIEGAGYTANDVFYEGTGHYSCLKTCNDWVNRGLKKAHIQTAIWSPFAFGVLRQAGMNE